MLVTTNGSYARDMELPIHQIHRTYRVRVHGPLTRYKIQAIQRGITIPNDTMGGGPFFQGISWRRVGVRGIDILGQYFGM